MAWIEIIDESEANGELAAAYETVAGSRGKLSNIMRVHSLNPSAMLAHLDLYVTIMFKRSGISRADRELIAAVVSKTNSCPYCVNHHEEALRFYWKDDARVGAVVRNADYSSLDGRQVEMLDYAQKLTASPEEVGADDVERLKAAGLTDRDVLDVNLITSYFNFVNRIALGLGVTFDASEMTGFKY
ncbi:MAG: peroxidase-related enzyme [Rhodothermales bacterium]|nr:peroxidase-related enzyme [Rhodothermales bacterium]